MKNILFIVILSISSISLAQKTMDIGDFKELKVYDLITVNLVPSANNEVIVDGKNSDYVKIINNNGVLKIRMELEERFDGDATKVTVYFNNISIIDANEGSIIYSENRINSSSLKLKTQEGGKINVEVETEELYIKSVSGGIIEVKGKTNQQDIIINSGGVYDGENLISNKTSVNVTAGGSATIYVIDRVDAKVTAGGSIKIYGNPKDIKKKKFAGGKIEIVKSKN